MEITVAVAELAPALKWVGAHVPTRPTVPVLAGLRLTASEGRLHLAATDYETWASATLEADTEDQGTVVLPGRLLESLVARLPADQDLHLRAEAASVQITCGTITARVRTLAADDYPHAPERPREIGCCQADALAAAVARVAPAAATDQALPALCCLALTPGPDGLTLAATDRYRVGYDRLDWSPALTTEDDERPLLVPAGPLARAVKGLEDEVALGTDGELISLATPTRQLLLRLGSQEFPRIASFAQDAREHARAVLTVDTKALATAVERARLFAETGVATIRVQITPDGVTVSGGTEGETGTETVPATVEGPEEETGFAVQAPYLNQALAAARSQTATLTVPAGHKPILTTGHADGDQGWHLFMPVRLAGR